MVGLWPRKSRPRRDEMDSPPFAEIEPTCIRLVIKVNDEEPHEPNVSK